MESLTRKEYKKKFLHKVPVEGKRTSIPVSRETKNKLRQLCTAVDGPRIPVGSLVENIIDEHCQQHSKAIGELYRNDIPVY